jgi:hypothetical protein
VGIRTLGQNYRNCVNSQLLVECVVLKQHSRAIWRGISWRSHWRSRTRSSFSGDDWGRNKGLVLELLSLSLRVVDIFHLAVSLLLRRLVPGRLRAALALWFLLPHAMDTCTRVDIVVHGPIRAFATICERPGDFLEARVQGEIVPNRVLSNVVGHKR